MLSDRVGEATEDVGEPADNLEVYVDEGDIEDDGDPGDAGLKGPEVLMERDFSCRGFRDFVRLDEVLVPMLELGDCGELGPDNVSTPDVVDTEEEGEVLAKALPDSAGFPFAAAPSSSSSAISLA